MQGGNVIKTQEKNVYTEGRERSGKGKIKQQQGKEGRDKGMGREREKQRNDSAKQQLELAKWRNLFYGMIMERGGARAEGGGLERCV